MVVASQPRAASACSCQSERPLPAVQPPTSAYLINDKAIGAALCHVGAWVRNIELKSRSNIENSRFRQSAFRSGKPHYEFRGQLTDRWSTFLHGVYYGTGAGNEVMSSEAVVSVVDDDDIVR